MPGVMIEPSEGGPSAAQYLRMSTDMQQYSFLHQATAIEAYAVAHGIRITRSYGDGGRSGLSLVGRPALQGLLADVEDRCPDFSVILVYDLSRWGRFQDVDEGAFLEFICRRAGYRIIYCAEPFPEESGPLIGIMKSIKRVMAAEYSRELSERCFAGQSRMASMGYRAGGYAGYGLRRVLLDRDGSVRTVLQRGEQKHLKTDRVVLRPGPREEVAVVRRIFRLFVHDTQNLCAIARILNEGGIEAEPGRPWKHGRVRVILQSEKYIGNLVFNRTRRRLKQPLRHNGADQWIRTDGAFKPIVPLDLFRRAQKLMALRSIRWTKEDGLRHLRRLLKKHGHLNTRMLRADPRAPGPLWYQKRLGGLLKAYQLVGFKPRRSFESAEGMKQVFRLRPVFARQVRDQLIAAGVPCTVQKHSRRISIGDGVRGIATVLRCQRDPDGFQFWTLHADTIDQADLYAVLALGETDPAFYFVVQPQQFGGQQEMRISTRNLDRTGAARTHSIAGLGLEIIRYLQSVEEKVPSLPG